MKALNILILILAFLTWCFISMKWYVCDIQELCGYSPSTEMHVESEEPVHQKEEISDQTIEEDEEVENSLSKEIQLKTEEARYYLSKSDQNHVQVVGQYYYGSEGGKEKAAKAVDQFRSTYFNDHLDRTSTRLSNLGAPGEGVDGDPTIDLFLTTSAVAAEDQGEGFAVIYFASGTANTDMDAYLGSYLEAIKAEMKGGDKVAIVIGHTDNEGEEIKNYNLALNRAKKVRTYLIDNGINGSNILSRSKGELAPIADNETPEGKQKNRRVEINFK